MSYEEDFSALEDAILNDHEKVAAAVHLFVLATLASSREDGSECTVHADSHGVRITAIDVDGEVLIGEGPTPLLAVADFEESLGRLLEAEDLAGEEWKQGP